MDNYTGFVLLLFLGAFAVISIAVFIWWLVMLIEALRIPSTRWNAVGQNQIIYVVAMILLGVIGTILYVIIPRKQLKQGGY